MVFNSIETFLAVASCRSISGAAEMLHVTQPAVSRRLRELESEMGAILIDRGKGLRQCNLTLAGERFLPVAERWLELRQDTRRLSTGYEAISLRLGASESINTYILPPVYMALFNNTPPVNLIIDYGKSVLLCDQIDRREFDVVFVGQLGSDPNLAINHVIVPFYEEPLLLIRHRGKRPAEKRIRAEELDPRQEIFVPWSPSFQIWHERVWGAVEKRLDLRPSNLITPLMENPGLWAVAPECVARQFRGKKAYEVQSLDPAPPNRVSYMITPRRPRMGAQRGIEILTALLRKHGYFNVQGVNPPAG